ncbi:acyl-CoA dehydrogenase [Leucobacter sp. OLJS4]|uniref:acyl-CoA dehydrogenase family protein n=1 Tax=unclassified Leucobacter TaxID=2621730 RepID=UPI000C1956BA|nr:MULTISPECIES: acyl-CoA dehydrogenase [unclassified Leucobacter]PIJ52484.1 acyl-CoA dehydrogenase [Leucobacter sp. OLES1]PII84037.1 acyl-CoA dehydrogenase [Leucobacter sp. OLCALW19]PII92348.1 acyl-CoA dehydrogenase [Leucobacter sp. OLAS13]PII98383.1 acyl-CoA dehydrogenase [Leucobacter sp. OLCS4]PII99669.1 acyl-CoA dehydrogenase [Leucobacter sp. OLDS2]
MTATQTVAQQGAADRAAATQQESARIDVPAVADALLGRWKEERLASRKLVEDPRLQTIPGQPMPEHRERALGQLGILVEEGAIQRAFPTDLGGSDNHGGNIAAFQELVLADPSLQIKSGVQWGLFGAAILHLGTRTHHEKWLPDVMSLKLPGAFAMTEIGHGSDVASIGTTATYDPATEEFEIHTPFAGAWKEFLGNAALHGQAAVVFAQLITKGVNHGVHAFFVPIRTPDGEMLPGVGSEDDGVKGGLNGIDNGRLHFSHVRIPRENLLNRYGDVAADGTYSSAIPSPGRRFFTMIGTLVQGRVSLDGSAVKAMMAALTIAIRYGSERRQFPGPDGRETVLLDYGLHQRRLIPRIAETYAMAFASERLLTTFDEVFSGVRDDDAHREDLETLAAALKPLSTWAALDTLQEVREACGGAGFIAKNRVVGLRADLDIYVTFEGDNNVLLQLVGKRLLTDYAAQFAGGDKAALARAAASQLGDRVSRFGLRQIGQSVADLGQVSRSVEQLRETETQRTLLTDRVQTMVAEIAGAMREATKDVPKGDKRAKAIAQADAFNAQQHKLIEAARAHAELLQWEAFTEALDRFDGETLRVLTWLRDLFGLGLLEKHATWYLVHGRLSGHRVEAITAYVDRLIGRVREHALDLVDAFGLTPGMLRAEIATGIEAERQQEAADYVREQQAAGTWPIHEKQLRKQQQG